MDPLHLAFAKKMNKQDALKRFNAALAELRKSGELTKIIVSESAVAGK